MHMRHCATTDDLHQTVQRGGAVTLFSRITKKISRRFRTKGSLAVIINRTGRNRQPLTAVALWESVFQFRETPAARAGLKRAEKRLSKRRRWMLL